MTDSMLTGFNFGAAFDKAQDFDEVKHTKQRLNEWKQRKHSAIGS